MPYRNIQGQDCSAALHAVLCCAVLCALWLLLLLLGFIQDNSNVPAH